jgi:VCBS repeat-containing protein
MRSLVRLCCALTAALALSIAFSSAQKASAATFNVDNAGDAPDIVHGNGLCADASGSCTLRAAIEEANSFAGNDTISISYTGTINLTGALPEITSDMTINGAGSSLLTVRRDTGGDYRIFLTNNVNVSISGMTITNGKTPDATSGNAAKPGGGIWQVGGVLTLTDMVITGNRTGNGAPATSGVTGGWGGDGGGISGGGTLTMTKVVVSNNTAGNGATGNFGGSGGSGGGVYFFGPTALTMTDCVVAGNTAGNAADGTAGGASGGGGGGGGGLYVIGGILKLSGLSVSGNTAGDAGFGGTGGHGGGIFTFPQVTTTITNSQIGNNITGKGGDGLSGQGGSGGGIFNTGPLNMINCTVNDNAIKGPSGGGGSSGGGIFNDNVLTMTNCTVSGNRTDLSFGRGGGIYHNGSTLTLTNCTITGNAATNASFQPGQGVHSVRTTNIRNTIIAGNSGDRGADVSGTFNSQGHNLIGIVGDSTGFTGGDQLGSAAAPLNARLGALADNGGRTFTHALLAGSPALDAGDNALASDANNNAPATDQRGSGRFADSTGTGANAVVDIGSYEFHPVLEDVTGKETPEDTRLSFSFNIGDAHTGTPSVTASSGDPSLVPDANLSITGSGATRTLRITPASNRAGAVVITLTVTGTDGRVVSDTFQLSITPVNDAPTFTIGTDQTVAEDTGAQTVAGWLTGIGAGAPDESGQALAFLVNVNTNAALFSTAPSISPSGTLTYTPAPDAFGSALVTVSLKDDGGTASGGRDTSDAQTFRINVTPVNDAPVAVDNGYGTGEDTPLSVAAPAVLGNDTDADPDTLVAELVAAPANGNLTLRANGSFTYTPNANFNGADSFTYRVNDGHVLSNVANVSLNISAVNDAPVNLVPAAPQRADAAPLIFSVANANAISVTDVDAGNKPVMVNLSSTNGTLTLKTTDGLSFSAGDGTADSNMTFTGSLPDINAALDGLSFAPRANFSGAGSIRIATNDLANTGAFALGDTDTVNITILPGGILQFSAPGYQFSEGVATGAITVTRTGDSTGAVSVNFATVDDPAAVPCDPTIKRADGASYPQGVAYARCDYATTIETVTFAPGDLQPKTIHVPLIDDAHVEGAETLQVRLFSPTGASLGARLTATLTINDNDAAGQPNPIFSTPFFVRMQYLDFLSREPEAGEPWSGVLNRCSDVNNNPACDRLLVSQSFFGSPEFRLKGFYVFNFYRVAFGRRPSYEEVIPDMRSVTGATEQEVYQKRAAFPVSFIARAEFKGLYDGLTDAAFVNTLLDRYGLQQVTTPDPANPEGGTKVTLTRADLINRLGQTGGQTLTRSQVLRAVVESNEVGAAEFNKAFVAMQYYGYLRRTPEEDGYQAWLRVINQDPQNVRIMVDGFMNSTEYRLRFGRVQ